MNHFIISYYKKAYTYRQVCYYIYIYYITLNK